MHKVIVVVDDPVFSAQITISAPGRYVRIS
jgi:hypothetical protein